MRHHAVTSTPFPTSLSSNKLSIRYRSSSSSKMQMPPFPRAIMWLQPVKETIRPVRGISPSHLETLRAPSDRRGRFKFAKPVMPVYMATQCVTNENPKIVSQRVSPTTSHSRTSITVEIVARARLRLRLRRAQNGPPTGRPRTAERPCPREGPLGAAGAGRAAPDG